MIHGISHVALSVINLERSIDFYRRVFGLSLASPIIPFEGAQFGRIQGTELPVGRIGYMSDGAAFQVELFEFTTPRPRLKDPNHSVADHGITHFCIDVVGIEDEVARMSALGARFHGPVETFAGANTRAAYGRDPDGNVFELVERSPR